MAGAIIFIAGLTRLGFLDSVLSRPFLRGFISAVGFVIIVDQLIPELGLQLLAAEVGGVNHASSVDKLRFLFANITKSSGITTAVSGISFGIIMVFRCVEAPYSLNVVNALEGKPRNASNRGFRALHTFLTASSLLYCLQF